MPIIAATPTDVRETAIFRMLRAKDASRDLATAKAIQLVEAATPLLDFIISGPFKTFTLHNRDHAKKLLHLAEYAIPSDTLEALSIAELLLLIYAAYLHDLGMSVTSIERERIITSDEFLDTERSWPELWASISNARTRLQSLTHSGDASTAIEITAIEAELFQLQEAGLITYLRPRHATPERYSQLIALLKKVTNRGDLFEFNGVSFESELIDICASHNLDSGVLAEVRGPYDERFPRDHVLGGERLNVQYCAAVLRVVDILDFDRERTPLVLFEGLGIASRSLPGAEVSLHEWQKHMAVHTIDIREDEIVVSAECRHPVIEKAIREFCQIIERDIRDTLAVLRRNPADLSQKYWLELPVSVRPSIKSVGYTYKDISLRLNQAAIMSLLMGERLYSQPGVSARELLQNAIDACAAREVLGSARSFSASISLVDFEDTAGRHWIECTDNGIGMDEHVISEYFLQLGNSYYNDPEFRRMIRKSGINQFEPISRFGIGLVSVFMLADLLEVDTLAAHSGRGDDTPRLIRIERMGALAFVTQSNRTTPGTTIRIRLRESYSHMYEALLDYLRQYLRDIIVRPKYDITVRLGLVATTLSNRQDFQVNQSLVPNDVEIVLLELSRWSNRMAGPAALLFAKHGDQLSYLRNNQQITFERLGVAARDLLIGYSGNRVAVNGFKMSMKGMNKVFGLGRKRIAMVFDVNIIGDESVKYDVSRDRLSGNGRFAVAKEFRDSILKGLEETGVLERLSEPTLDILKRSFGTSDDTGWYWGSNKTYAVDEAVVKQVLDMLPKSEWPTGLHKQIAEQLKISHGKAAWIIDRLLSSGRVKKPGSHSLPSQVN